MKYLIFYMFSFVFFSISSAEELATLDFLQPVEVKDWQIQKVSNHCVASTHQIKVNGSLVESGVEMKVFTPIVYDWMIDEKTKEIKTSRMPFALLSISSDSLNEAAGVKLFEKKIKRSSPYYWQFNTLREEEGVEVLEYYFDFRYIYRSEKSNNPWGVNQSPSLGEILIFDNYLDFKLNGVSFRVSLSGSGEAYRQSVVDCAKRQINDDSTNVTKLDKEIIGKILGIEYFYNYGSSTPGWESWEISPIDVLVQFGQQQDTLRQKKALQEKLLEEKHNLTTWNGELVLARKKARDTKSEFEEKSKDIKEFTERITEKQKLIAQATAELEEAQKNLSSLQDEFVAAEKAFDPAKNTVAPIDENLKKELRVLAKIESSFSKTNKRKEEINNRIAEIPEERNKLQEKLNVAVKDLEEALEDKEEKEENRSELLNDKDSIIHSIEYKSDLSFSELDKKRMEFQEALRAANEDSKQKTALYNLSSFIVDTTESLTAVDAKIKRMLETEIPPRSLREERRRLITLLSEAQLKMVVDFIAHTFTDFENYQSCAIATKDDFCSYEANEFFSEMEDLKSAAEKESGNAQEELNDFHDKEKSMLEDLKEKYTEPLAIVTEEVSQLRAKVSDLRESVVFYRSGLNSLPSEKTALISELSVLVPEIKSLEEQKKAQENVIKPIQQKYDATVKRTNYTSLKEKFNSAVTELRKAERIMSDNPGKIKKDKQDLKEYEGKLTEAQAVIGDLETVAEEAASELDVISKRVETVRSELKEIEEFISDARMSEFEVIPDWKDYINYIVN